LFAPSAMWLPQSVVVLCIVSMVALFTQVDAKRRVNHGDLVEHVASVADQRCHDIAKGHKKWKGKNVRMKGKKWATRCQLFTKQVESLGGKVATPERRTSAEVLEAASQKHDDLLKYLEAAADYALDEVNPSEADIDLVLQKEIYGWMANVVGAKGARDEL